MSTFSRRAILKLMMSGTGISLINWSTKLPVIALAFQPRQTVAIGDVDVEELVNIWFLPVESDMALQKSRRTYESMTSAQYQNFITLLGQQAMRLYGTKEPFLSRRVELSGHLLNRVNEIALATAGIPFNQLTPQIADPLVQTIWREEISPHYRAIVKDQIALRSLQTPSEGSFAEKPIQPLSSPSSCECATFIYTCVGGGQASSSNCQGYQWIANQANCSDCDLEAAYPANAYVIKYITSGAYFCYSYYGNGSAFIRRQPSTARVLIGNRAVSLFFGGSEIGAAYGFRLD